MFILCFILILPAISNAQDDFVTTIKAGCPTGLQMWIPDAPSTKLVAFHLSVNEPLAGTAAGQYNLDIMRKNQNRWEMNIPDLKVKNGDVINYWVYRLQGNRGRQKTDLSYKITGDPCSEQTTKAPLQTDQPERPISPTNKPKTCLKPSISETNKGLAYCVGDLLFEDNFNTLDMAKWQHEISASGGGNHEFQVYVNNRSVSFIENGALHIRPVPISDRFGEDFLYEGTLDVRGNSPISDQCTNPSFDGCYKKAMGSQIVNPIMSARLRTAPAFSFKYGRVEIRAKLPAGDWMWTSLQLLPRHNGYGEWPNSGEMDFVEHRGNKDLYQSGGHIGNEQVTQTLHFGPFWNYDVWQQAHVKLRSPRDKAWDNDFHVYGLEWTKDYVKFLVDNEEKLNISPPPEGFWAHGNFDRTYPYLESPYRYATKMAPFDQEFYIVLSMAIGGTNPFFPDAKDSRTNNPKKAKPWKNSSPKAALEFWKSRDTWLPSWQGDSGHLQVDYVRVYAV